MAGDGPGFTGKGADVGIRDGTLVFRSGGGAAPLQACGGGGFLAGDRLTAEVQAPDGRLMQSAAASWTNSQLAQYLLSLPALTPGSYRLRVWAEHAGESVLLLDVPMEVIPEPVAIRAGRFFLAGMSVDRFLRPDDEWSRSTRFIFEICRILAVSDAAAGSGLWCVATCEQFRPVDAERIARARDIPLYEWWAVRRADGEFAMVARGEIEGPSPAPESHFLRTVLATATPAPGSGCGT